MYESKVSTVKSQQWDSISIMRNSNIKSHAFIPVPCPTHSDYSITNICKSVGCIQPLCPECITAHVELHQQTRKPAKIQNIINTRISCIQKLGQIYEQLTSQYQKYEKSCGSNLEGFLQKNRKKVELARNKIVNFVQNYFAELEEKIELLEVAYLNQRERKSKEVKSKAAPLLSHIDQISQYKAELESEDYIPALIQLLNDPPKKPPTLSKIQFEEFGEVKIDEYAFETFKTSLQSFIKVQSLLPQGNQFSEQINRNNSKFSNQVQFSRIGRSSSRELIQSQLQNSRNQANTERSNSRKKIFSNQKKGDFSQVYNSTVMRSSSVEKVKQVGNISLNFESSFQQVTLIDRNYFLYDKGLLAYFPENQSYFYATQALCADRGFQRFDLPESFVIPSDHQCIVTSDSRVFLIGGRLGNKSLSDCYQIQLKQMNRGNSVVKKSSPMNEPRGKFSAVYFNNYIYVFGGKKDNMLLSSCQRYNIQSDRWQSIKNMPQALMSLNVCTFNDKILKFGGIQQNGQILNRVDIFYPQNNTWTKLNSEIPFFIKIGSCQLNQTELLIFGGQTPFNTRRTECFLLREQKKNEFKFYPCLNSLYNQGSFESSYVYKNSLLAIQNGQNNKNKIIMKLDCGKWRFLSC